MFKLTHVFFLLAMLAAAAQGTELCCSDIQASLADLKSDVKALQTMQDLVHDLRARLGQQFGWPAPLPVQIVKPSPPLTVKQRKVAFFVGLKKHLGPFTQNTDIVFDRIVTNIGAAYSVSTGRFTAPVTAAYQFSLTIAAKHGKKAGVQIVHNGAEIRNVWSVATPEWAPSSAEVILWLKAGDQVWLKLFSYSSDVFGEMRTTFSGFLIFND